MKVCVSEMKNDEKIGGRVFSIQTWKKIEKKLEKLRTAGHKPYCIEGGHHGNSDTEEYVQCYREIKRFEEELGIHFDYIFFASGTGITQAGTGGTPLFFDALEKRWEGNKSI